MDGTKKNLPDSEELREYFDAPHRANFPRMITGVMFDVPAKLPVNYMRAPLQYPGAGDGHGVDQRTRAGRPFGA